MATVVVKGPQWSVHESAPHSQRALLRSFRSQLLPVRLPAQHHKDLRPGTLSCSEAQPRGMTDALCRHPLSVPPEGCTLERRVWPRPRGQVPFLG